MYANRSSWLLRGLLAANLNITGVGNHRYNSNYYEVLGIPQTSTQTDIKSAYYKLSKMYHPDKNQGSESAGVKFRQITQAYEVLGNYRMRRLYDKGIIHTAGEQYAQPPEAADMEPAKEDDPETKFYKSRFHKEKVPDSMGRTPIYDFDEWSRAHYGKSFERRQTAKSKYDRQETAKKDNLGAKQNEVVIFGMMLSLIAIYVFFHLESAHDTPQKRAQRQAEDKLKAMKSS